jgi:hypothetical protein
MEKGKAELFWRLITKINGLGWGVRGEFGLRENNVANTE